MGNVVNIYVSLTRGLIGYNGLTTTVKQGDTALHQSIFNTNSFMLPIILLHTVLPQFPKKHFVTVTVITQCRNYMLQWATEDGKKINEQRLLLGGINTDKDGMHWMIIRVIDSGYS